MVGNLRVAARLVPCWLVERRAEEEEGLRVPVGIVMPGAWGASARSVPTFLVPDALPGSVVGGGLVGVVWA